MVRQSRMWASTGIDAEKYGKPKKGQRKMGQTIVRSRTSAAMLALALSLLLAASVPLDAVQAYAATEPRGGGGFTAR